MSDDPRIRNDVRNGPLSLARSMGKPMSPAGGALALGRSDDQFNRRAPVVPNIWKIAHGALRGRYALVIVLGVACAVALGIFAYKFTAAPMFTSEGLINIAYTKPVVLQATDQADPLPQFDTYMQSQKTLITSRRTIDNAVKDPIWHGSPPTNADNFFAKHLIVTIPENGTLIDFKATAANSQTAAAVVNSIIDAYSDMYNAQDQQVDTTRLNFLQGQQRDLQATIANVTQQIRAKAQTYGSTQLDDQIRQIQDALTKQETKLNDLKIMIAATPSQPAPSSTGATAGHPAAGPQLTVEQIVALDPVTRTYWEREAQDQGEVDRLTKYGYGPAHRLMVAATRSLQADTALTQRAADDYRKSHSMASSAQFDNPAMAVGTPGQSMAELKQIEANLQKLHDQTMAQLIAVNNSRMDLTPLQAKLASTQADLGLVTRRLNDLGAENVLGGRLTVKQRGEESLQPSLDKRGRNATIAGLGGFFLPALAVIGLSLMRRRYRYSDEPGTDGAITRVPLLGMLPNVPARGSTPQLRVAAAYAAHHLRVLLSSRATTVVKRTFLVTSAGEGDGKTTVTMALAISFAAAKHRTLVIDADFVSRRMTRGFNAEQQEGLFESLGHGDLDGQWLNAASNLCILPTGKVDAADACGITAENVRLLLEQAVQHFDVVLIDTGSILGSPESAVLAREVDGVIVTISRNQAQSQVKKAMLRLEALGAAVIGRVFNMADVQDFRTSYVTPTSGWNEPMRPESSEVSELQQRVANFGPLVRAVAAAVPSEPPREGPRIGSSEHATRP